MPSNHPNVYAILKPKGLGFELLLPYATLEEAREFMRQRNLTKVNERHFADGLIQWIVQ